MRYRIATDYTHLTKEEGMGLKEKRKGMGLSIKDVTKRIGTNEVLLSVIERKGGQISLSILDKLNKYYKYYAENVNR